MRLSAVEEGAKCACDADGEMRYYLNLAKTACVAATTEDVSEKCGEHTRLVESEDKGPTTGTCACIEAGAGLSFVVSLAQDRCVAEVECRKIPGAVVNKEDGRCECSKDLEVDIAE